MSADPSEIVTASPECPVTTPFDSTQFKSAQAKAAAGGWPDQPMCEFHAHKKTLWAWAVATFFGAGLLKPGPGTYGSIAATLIWAAVAFLAHPSPAWMLGLTLAGIVLAIALGVPAATIAAIESGRHDPGFVVIDEVAGQWITLLALTAMATDWRHGWKQVLLALALFRLFDITKPFPVRQLEKLPAGWGIVFDDLGAGLYAWAVLLFANRWMH